MASYNGSAYIREQLASILLELGERDEVVVVDDASSDDTCAVIEALDDPRVRVRRNPVNRGHVHTFGEALALAKNEFVFLSDQDDRWIPGRVARMIAEMNRTGSEMIVSTYSCINALGNPIPTKEHFFLRAGNSKRRLANITGIFFGRRTYYGCTMAIRQELLREALPMPGFVESHDLWLAMAGNMRGDICHLEQDTVERRIHDSNLTTRNRGHLMQLKSRIVMLLSLGILMKRRWF